MEEQGNDGRSGERRPISYLSSSSSKSRIFEFDVFLSFRGEDTRYGFTSFLYNALRKSGIRTFRDSEELEKGEEVGKLMDKIEASEIFIPVLSENYAESRWCLRELSKIVDSGRLAIPIFYYIEPSAVRHQTGSFSVALEKHKESEELEEGTISKWRNALRRTGEISGFLLSRHKQQDEAEVVDMVVRKLWSILHDRTPLDVAEHLIGIQSRVEEVIKLLNLGSDDVRMVAILGMGGIGKTTIAKEVYNKIFLNFDSSFISNVGSVPKGDNGLISLQNQIICGIVNDKVRSVVDVSQGRSVLKSRVYSKKVLVILDDVNDEIQIYALAGDPSWFGYGSRIIITTRYRSVLNQYKAFGMEIYQPTELNDQESLQLFSCHVFQKYQPPDEYAQISKRAAFAIGGLPLALQVIAQAFVDLDKIEDWQIMLKNLEKIPRDKILEKLKASYDALTEMEQQIFLDAACFFIGMDKEDAFHIWDNCGYSPDISIRTLLAKSLIRIVDNNKLNMHDQLRELGRWIVQKENFHNPGKRSRLWCHNEVLDVLHKLKVKKSRLSLLSFDLVLNLV